MPDKRVMIVDDDRALVQALRKRIESLGIEVITAHDGMTVCAALAHDRKLAPIPVIMLTGKSDQSTIRRCEELGAFYLQKSADVWDRLNPLLGELLELKDQAVNPTPVTATEKKTDTTIPKILVIDDDPDISKAIKIRLKAYGVDVIRAFNGMQGYWAALKENPSAIICDFNMPEGPGNYILGRLKSHSMTKNIPVIILTGRTVGTTKDYSLERELLLLGAAKYFTKPLDFDEFLGELRKHVEFPAISAGLGVLSHT